jgi:hypothetical protein
MFDLKNQENIPALSAIVIIPDTFDTIQRLIKCLQTQTAVKQMEIVMVVSSCQHAKLNESELACFHSWKAVEVGKLESIGQGYAAGIRQANAPIIALTQDHAFPDNRWAELFIAAHEQQWAAVGPEISNGNPNTMICWADFYISYGEWAHPAPSGVVRHLPGHNSCYKRDILIEYGTELEELFEAESIFHRRLKAQGYELFLESDTCTQHINHTMWKLWMRKRYYQGRQFMSTWTKSWSWLRRLIFVFASPLVVCLRLWRVRRHISRGKDFTFFIYLTPVLLLGLLAEGTGQIIGSVAGRGNCSEKMLRFEFDRLKHAGLI